MERAKVKDYMTENAHSINDELPLSRAKEKMRELHCRHLPVLHGGEIVGIVSERDLDLLIGFVDADKTPVSEAMTPDPYVVTSETDIREVARDMAKMKIGSAIVRDDLGHLGIFTVSDALVALVEFS